MNGGTSAAAASKAQQKSFRAKVTLSRPSYRLGTSVVGTIRIHPNHRSESSTSSLRDNIKNAVVYVAGFCRVDSRWHDVSNYSRMYGPFHPQLAELYGMFDPKLLSQGDDTVCFWATNGLQLLELPERKVGSWNPRSEDDDEGKEDEQQQQAQLTFTFRVDVPHDLPPSINANTCRYFYSAEVLIRTNSDEQDVIKAPFSVVADPNQPPPKSAIRNQVSAGVKTHHVSSGRVKFGTCTGMAHSIGLPCHISATEIHRPRGQMTVQPSQLLSIRGGRSESLQTLRVNNSQDRPVCVLTLVGSTKLTPGSRIHIKWDFPSIATMASLSAISGGDGEKWVPCHQVSAALMGEEFAIYEDGTTKRTRSFVFDTCNELVESGGGTDRICKTLLLPSDAPSTICTDIMEISISCQIDITVEEVTGKYTNLKLEIPCHVVQNMDDDMDEFEHDDLVASKSVRELVYGDKDKKTNGQEHEFKMTDILQDLKILALQMEQALHQEDKEKEQEEKEDYKLRIV